jgi:AcrR family transcriptional regulator
MKYPNTKRQILEKSFEFFSTHGYSGASIRQISRAVGIRESAIYNHYKSKEEIFSAILSEFKSKSIGKEILSDDLLDDLSNPEKFLKNFTKRLIEYWNRPEEKKFIRLLLMEQFTKIGSHVLSISDYLIELRSICKMIFGEMIKAGIILKNDSQILTEEFIAPLFLLRTEKMSSDEIQNINEIFTVAEKHVDYFWSAVKSKNK